MDQRANISIEGEGEPVSTGHLTCELFESAEHIPSAAWFAVVQSEDWPMHPDVLHLQERTLTDQARFWFGIVKTQQGKPQACAAFALFSTDVIQASPQVIKAAVAPLRRLWPHTLNAKILFCGLPIPDGGNHLRIHPSAHGADVLRCIDATMLDLARSTGALIMVIKEFTDNEASQMHGLEDLGYVRGDIPPMHHFTQPFESFEAYRDALRSNYRRQLDASITKFEALGATVSHYMEPDTIRRKFTDEVHGLYLNVLAHSAHRLETLPAAFFRELPLSIPDDVVLTLVEHRGKPLAFAFGIHRNHSFSNLYVGCDYTVNSKADLYFNVFYLSMSAAFERGARQMKLGATSDDFKARLGCSQSNTCTYARATGTHANKVFHAFSGLLFPPVTQNTPRRVFRETPRPGA